MPHSVEMARVGGDGNKYPPTEFSQKYAAVLAPKGKLVSPKDVFEGEGAFDKGYDYVYGLFYPKNIYATD